MLNWLGKYFKSDEQPEELPTPANIDARFVLTYKDLVLGYLNHSLGIWEFWYAEEFKKQNEIDVLVDFPDKNQKYLSSYLWPFFAHRIPGLGQPRIQAIIEREHIKNEVDLLKRFGQRSISNPFELEVA
jgi:hypothetical protein